MAACLMEKISMVFAVEYAVKLNVTKSELLIHTRNPLNQSAIEVKFMGGIIPVVDCYKHLGVIMGRDNMVK